MFFLSKKEIVNRIQPSCLRDTLFVLTCALRAYDITLYSCVGNPYRSVEEAYNVLGMSMHAMAITVVCAK